MILTDVAMVAADTSRSRVYLQMLERENLLPSYVVLLESPRKELPGQVGSKAILTLQAGDDYDLTESLRTTLLRAAIPFEVAASHDINEDSVVNAIKARPENVFIYSGFGGALLRDSILACGKRFLHVHGGYLPDYKGSTTNYYSLLDDGSIGASAIFLTANIDSGPVLVRRRFAGPKDRESLDHGYDSKIRSVVLVEVLKRYVCEGGWHIEDLGGEEGETYFVMHPVLRHLAILAAN